MKKEFDYAFAEIGDFFNLDWTSKKLEFKKSHLKEIEEELRLENLTSNQLILTIEEHGLIEHPKKITLKPKEVKNIKLKLSCNKIKGKHKSFLVIKSKNQTENIPINIEHVDEKEELEESF